MNGRLERLLWAVLGVLIVAVLIVEGVYSVFRRGFDFFGMVSQLPGSLALVAM